MNRINCIREAIISHHYSFYNSFHVFGANQWQKTLYNCIGNNHRDIVLQYLPYFWQCICIKASSLITKAMRQFLILLSFIVTSSVLLSCGAAKKAERAEAKRKREAAKLEQLERDKQQFEQRNKGDLGK